jgi:hypothetical protein
MSNAPSPPHSPMIGGAIVGVFALIAALVFAGVYVGLPENGHFYALVTIGILALVFALGAYLAQAVAPDPLVPRALSWGFAGLGFALLFGTILLDPTGLLGFSAQVVVLVVLLLFLLVALFGGYWRYRSVAIDRARLAHREGWNASTPRSALDYAAAQHDREVTQSSSTAAKGPP